MLKFQQNDPSHIQLNPSSYFSKGWRKKKTTRVSDLSTIICTHHAIMDIIRQLLPCR